MRAVLHEETLPARPRGSYPRSEDTRRRLIETAISAFGELGFEGASTRLLAERAGVNLPAIQYHFGSKDGLYRAAVDHIAQYIEEQMAPVGSRVRAALAGDKKVSRRVLSSLLQDLLETFVLLVFGGGKPGRRQHVESNQLFIARAEVEQAQALESLYATMRRCVSEPCSVLVGKLIGQPAKSEQTRLRTVAIIGQATVFCCKPARRTLGWDAFSGAHVRAVQKIVNQHTRAILDGRAQPAPKSKSGSKR